MSEDGTKTWMRCYTFLINCVIQLESGCNLTTETFLNAMKEIYKMTNYS